MTANANGWILFKEAMKKQNAASRALLRLRNSLIWAMRETASREDKGNTPECVVITVEKLCAVKSFDPCDYLVKTQVDLIVEDLMRCNSVRDLTDIVQKLVSGGKIWTGRRFLTLHDSVRDILCQYTEYVSAGMGKRRSGSFS